MNSITDGVLSQPTPGSNGSSISPASTGSSESDSYDTSGSAESSDSPSSADSSPSSGSSDPPAAPDEPALYVSATTLDFGTAVYTLTFLIRNAGRGTMDYVISNDLEWLSLDHSAGTSSGEYHAVRVTVERGNREFGPHTGEILVHAADTTHRIFVHMEVDEASSSGEPPVLELSTDVLEFGSTESTMSFTVHNAGAGVFTYAIAANEEWISGVPDRGENAGEYDTIVVIIDRGSLAPGAYVANLTVWTDGGLMQPVFATVMVDPEQNPGGPEPPSEAQIVAWLTELEPLQKVHYSYPFAGGHLIDPNDPLLYHYVRLTHAITMHGLSQRPGHMDSAVAACQQVNASGPAIPATMAIQYSPWHYVFPASAPPTYTGPEHDEEINLCRTRFETIRGWIADANAARNADISVSAAVLDSERFWIRDPADPESREWNDAITAKYDAITQVVLEIFPEIKIEWYDRGAVIRCQWENGWCEKSYFTYEETGDTFACSLYTLPELGRMRDTFRNTYENASAHAIAEVTPWVALGAGYQRDIANWNAWTFVWDYDPFYSWQLGAEINQPSYGANPERFAPWDAARNVIFYPRPFDPRAPYWAKHFVAYVRGANGITQLPE